MKFTLTSKVDNKANRNIWAAVAHVAERHALSQKKSCFRGSTLAKNLPCTLMASGTCKIRRGCKGHHVPYELYL